MSPRTRFFSRLMLGLVFLLLMMAHVALPCAMASRERAKGPRGGMCTEAKVFGGGTDTNQYFLVPMPSPIEIDAVLAFAIVACVAVAAIVGRPFRRTPGVSARGRPFISSVPALMPYFARQDA